MLRKICYLNMDGILADFVHGTCRVHAAYGRNNPYLERDNWGKWDIEKCWGISANQFWKPIDADDYFWENLPKMPDADAIVGFATRVFGEENVGVLTAPSNHPSCIIGKRKWMKWHYPQFIDRMIFAKNKGLVAGPGKLLIDDKEANCDDFTKSGGDCILVPRLWNKDYMMANVPNSFWDELHDAPSENHDKWVGVEK